MGIISSFLLFALRSLEIEPLEKFQKRKCFPTSLCLKATPPHGSEGRKVSKAAGPECFLSQTLNTHCMNLVKWKTIALLNFLLFFLVFSKWAQSHHSIAHIKRGVSITAESKSNTGNPPPKPSV